MSATPIANRLAANAFTPSTRYAVAGSDARGWVVMDTDTALIFSGTWSVRAGAQEYADERNAREDTILASWGARQLEAITAKCAGKVA